MNEQASRFQSTLSEVIAKLITIFGPDITFARLSHIRGLRFDNQGKITRIEGVDEDILNQIKQHFVQLSPNATQLHIIPLLDTYSSQANHPTSPAQTAQHSDNQNQNPVQ